MKGKTVALLVTISIITSSLLTFGVLQTKGETLDLVVKSVLGMNLNSQASGSEEPPAGTIPATVTKQGSSEADLPPEFDRLIEAYTIIKDSYYDKAAVESDNLIEGAIKGMIQELDDPYTSYMDTEESKMFQESLESSFEGIGTEVMMLNNRVTVISPFKDSPAEKAGLRPNDQIIRVDDESIEGLTLQEAVKKIRGPKGTKVKLSVVRPGMSEPLTIVVVRDEIPLETVYSELFTVDGKKIGKIELTSFSANTAERFFEEFNSIKRQGAKGIVIDVRGNPGGYLDSVLKIAEKLVPEKGIILQVEDREGKRVTYNSTLRGEGFPVALLINQGSASASEILAGALKDSGYPIIGENTFGKGTVQVPKLLEDGGSIKITIAKWLTPDGTWIHQKGIEPTIPVSQPDYFNAAPINLEAPLKKEMSGVEIQNVQLILKGLGFNPNRQDGFFDATTEQSVQSFQKANGLPVTGMVDEATAVKMQELLYEKLKNPQNDLQLQTALKRMAESLK